MKKKFDRLDDTVLEHYDTCWELMVGIDRLYYEGMTLSKEDYELAIKLLHDAIRMNRQMYRKACIYRDIVEEQKAELNKLKGS